MWLDRTVSPFGNITVSSLSATILSNTGLRRVESFLAVDGTSIKHDGRVQATDGEITKWRYCALEPHRRIGFTPTTTRRKGSTYLIWIGISLFGVSR